MTTIRIPLLLCLTLLTAPLLIATAQFRTLGWEGGMTDLYYNIQGRKAPLSVNEARLSEAYRLPQSGKLELYRISHTDPLGQPNFEPVATVPIPEHLSRAILILRTTPEGDYATHWLDDSPEVTPAGTMRIHNLSSSDLAVGLADSVQSISLGGQMHEALPQGVRSIPVRIAIRQDNGWDYTLSISQPVRPSLRFLVIVRDARPSLVNPDATVEWIVFHEVPPVVAAP